METIRLKAKTLAHYAAVVADDIMDRIDRVARSLQGARVLHLNSTAAGGGVAELLHSLVPLEQECGLAVEWQVMPPDDAFFGVTKALHNGLQGDPVPISRADRSRYVRHNQVCAAELAGCYDVVIVHDPQPAAVRHYAPHRGRRWVWRCHIDTSAPHPPVWDLLRPFVTDYDVAVFTRAAFVPPDLRGPGLAFIPPAIDPLAPKNGPLARHHCRDIVARYGIDLRRPLVVQVSRFDPWKDPLGVIAAFRQVQSAVPAAQLALVGAMADDDPQGWEIYQHVLAAAAGDPNLFVLTDRDGIGHAEVNAFQRVADVVVQKSLREGFGLVVAEAMWKGTPVVGGNTGGIPLQLQDGVGGFLVDSITGCADRVTYLLTHPDEAALIARRGWNHVQKQFLTPRLLLDELELVQALVCGQV